MQIALFRECMDRATALKIESDTAENPNVSYAEVFTRVDIEFGGSSKEGLRQKLYALKIDNKGKMGEQEWRDVHFKALNLQRQVGDVGPEESSSRRPCRSTAHGGSSWPRRP